jgi:hypothetical protein
MSKEKLNFFHKPPYLGLRHHTAPAIGRVTRVPRVGSHGLVRAKRVWGFQYFTHNSVDEEKEVGRIREEI